MDMLTTPDFRQSIERIEEIRNQLDFSQTIAAQHCGVSLATYQRWVNHGTRPRTPAILQQVQRALQQFEQAAS